MYTEVTKKAFLELLNDLNKSGSGYRCKKMPKRGVYRISKIGRLVDCEGNLTDGWFIANRLKHALDTVYLDQSISIDEFFSFPILICSKYIEVRFF